MLFLIFGEVGIKLEIENGIESINRDEDLRIHISKKYERLKPENLIFIMSEGKKLKSQLTLREQLPESRTIYVFQPTVNGSNANDELEDSWFIDPQLSRILSASNDEQFYEKTITALNHNIKLYKSIERNQKFQEIKQYFMLFYEKIKATKENYCNVDRQESAHSIIFLNHKKFIEDNQRKFRAKWAMSNEKVNQVLDSLEKLPRLLQKFNETKIPLDLRDLPERDNLGVFFKADKVVNWCAENKASAYDLKNKIAEVCNLFDEKTQEVSEKLESLDKKYPKIIQTVADLESQIKTHLIESFFYELKEAANHQAESEIFEIIQNFHSQFIKAYDNFETKINKLHDNELPQILEENKKAIKKTLLEIATEQNNFSRTLQAKTKMLDKYYNHFIGILKYLEVIQEFEQTFFGIKDEIYRRCQTKECLLHLLQIIDKIIDKEIESRKGYHEKYCQRVPENSYNFLKKSFHNFKTITKQFAEKLQKDTPLNAKIQKEEPLSPTKNPNAIIPINSNNDVDPSGRSLENVESENSNEYDDISFGSIDSNDNKLHLKVQEVTKKFLQSLSNHNSSSEFRSRGVNQRHMVKDILSQVDNHLNFFPDMCTKELNNFINRLTKKLDDYEIKVENLEKKIARQHQFQVAQKQALSKLDEYEKLLELNKELKNTVDQLLQEKNALADHFTNSVNSNDFNNLKKELELKNKNNEELNIKYNIIEKEWNNSQMQAKKLDEDLKLHTNKITELTELLKIKETEFMAKIELLDSKVSMLETEKIEFQNKIKKQEEECLNQGSTLQITTKLYEEELLKIDKSYKEHIQQQEEKIKSLSNDIKQKQIDLEKVNKNLGEELEGKKELISKLEIANTVIEKEKNNSANIIRELFENQENFQRTLAKEKEEKAEEIKKNEDMTKQLHEKTILNKKLEFEYEKIAQEAGNLRKSIQDDYIKVSNFHPGDNVLLIHGLCKGKSNNSPAEHTILVLSEQNTADEQTKIYFANSIDGSPIKSLTHGISKATLKHIQADKDKKNIGSINYDEITKLYNLSKEDELYKIEAEACKKSKVLIFEQLTNKQSVCHYPINNKN